MTVRTQIITPGTMIRIGEALFGPQWKVPLARELGVDKRTITYISKGEHGVSLEIAKGLQTVVTKRLDVLGKLADTLNASVARFDKAAKSTAGASAGVPA